MSRQKVSSKQSKTPAVSNTQNAPALNGDGTRNKPYEEIGGHTYYEFIVTLLKQNAGVITQEQLEEAVKATFSHLWGKADKRQINDVSAKWQNMLDWAKSMGTREAIFFNRRKQIKGKKVTYIVMPVICEDAELVAWVLAKHRKSSFRKNCPFCNSRNPLSAEICANCKRPFPPATKKRELL